MSIKENGCCGAHCKTRMVFLTKGQCKGCKLGYDDGYGAIIEVQPRTPIS
jgi:hypothetical protein